MSYREKKLLTLFIEESAEATQEICKMLHHGIDNVNPVTGVSNLDKLHTEVGDLLVIVEMLMDYGVLSLGQLEEAKAAKRQRLKVWHPDLFG